MYINGLTAPVFPLKKIDAYAHGYYMDAQSRIFSTKNRGIWPVMLSGSVTPSGRYYTLNKRTHRADELARKAHAHKDFVNETTIGMSQPVNGVVAQGGPPVALPGRTKSAREAVNVKGYMLVVINPQGKLVFSTDPVFHLKEDTAKAEAERIAGNSGAEVVMMKVVGKVKVQKAVWE